MSENSPAAAVQYTWLLEDHLMFIKLPEILTTAALLESDAEMVRLLDASSSSFVHFLTDARALRVYPSLADYMGVKSLRHPHIGWSMTVGVMQQPLLRFFLVTVMSAARVRYRDFETMEVALAFARTIDPSLVDLNVSF